LEFIEDSKPSQNSKKKTTKKAKKKKKKETKGEEEDQHEEEEMEADEPEPFELSGKDEDMDYMDQLEETTTKKVSHKKKESTDSDFSAEDEPSHFPTEEDDLDPELKAALDKEVEEFRQRLESMNSQTV
jgi:hypothetical protein